MSSLPSVNALVEIVIKEQVSRSKIEDEGDDGVLTVAAPIGGAAETQPPAPGTEFELAWFDSNARYAVPVVLVDVTTGRQPSWLLRPVGEPELRNRRMYVRGGGGEEIEILHSSGGMRITAIGKIIDVSEGGVRLWLSKCDFRPGDMVTVGFSLDDAAIDTGGKVLYLRRPGQGGHGVDVVVTFKLKETTAKVIRRYLFQRELAERRRERKLQEDE